jgi:serine/threonine protein phosphatase 1
MQVLNSEPDDNLDGADLSRRTFFIGDVHGRADLLVEMLVHVDAMASALSFEPQVVFLGDIVDRGVDSRGALEAVHVALRKWPTSKLVISNHDDMFAAAVQGRLSDARQRFWIDQCGGWQTCASYHPSGEIDDAADVINTRFEHHLSLIREASPMVKVGAFVACHAGINGWLPLDRQDRHDLMWITDGFLDRVDDRMPPVIHGHSDMGDLPVVTENRISIDTGAFESGRLTAFYLDRAERKHAFYQTSSGGPVGSVLPLVHDRGRGSLLDRMDTLLAQ